MPVGGQIGQLWPQGVLELCSLLYFTGIPGLCLWGITLPFGKKGPHFWPENYVDGSLRLLFEKHEAAPDGYPHQSREVVHAELGHEIGAMFLHCLGTETEDFGYGRVGMPFSDELQDFSLAWSELIKRAV